MYFSHVGTSTSWQRLTPYYLNLWSFTVHGNTQVLIHSLINNICEFWLYLLLETCTFLSSTTILTPHCLIHTIYIFAFAKFLWCLNTSASEAKIVRVMIVTDWGSVLRKFNCKLTYVVCYISLRLLKSMRYPHHKDVLGLCLT